MSELFFPQIHADQTCGLIVGEDVEAMLAAHRRGHAQSNLDKHVEDEIVAMVANLSEEDVRKRLAVIPRYGDALKDLSHAEPEELRVILLNALLHRRMDLRHAYLKEHARKIGGTKDGNNPLKAS